MKITVKQLLAMHSNVSRKTTHLVKPMVTTDQKKAKNKKECRKKVDY